jgi:hypothetical protein
MTADQAALVLEQQRLLHQRRLAESLKAYRRKPVRKQIQHLKQQHRRHIKAVKLLKKSQASA